jgi:L-lactate utilization protein LutB
MPGDSQYSAIHFLQTARVDQRKWNRIPSSELLEQTVEAIGRRAMDAVVAENGEAAMAVIRELIPKGATVMSGSSTTLIEIGFENYVAEGESGWRSIRERILAENDERKRSELRRHSITADYFLSSANAIAATGEIVACDASGSRVGAWPYGAGRLVIVAGVNKIVPTLADAFDRIREYSFPLENARAIRAYGTPSMFGKYVILAGERNPDRTTVILVNEELGY